MVLSPLLQPVSFEALPGWRQDDKSSAFEAFRRSARQVVAKPYKSGALGIDFAAFAEAYEAARLASPSTAADASAFFEAHFVPMRVQSDKGTQGLVTGFYEPEAEASPVRTARFKTPLLSRPADLVDVDDDNRPASLDPYLAFGRAAAPASSNTSTAPRSSRARLRAKVWRSPGSRTRSTCSSSMSRALPG